MILTTEEKLKHFEESSIAKATSLASNMVGEHQKALDKIFSDHKQGKDRQVALQIRTETESIQRANNMELSKEQLKLKRLLTQHQNELKDKLFSEVIDKLDAYKKTDDYIALLKLQVEDILRIARGQEVHIYLDVDDAPLLDCLTSEKNISFMIAKSSFLGGTKAVIPSRRILIDHSFQTKLEEMKKEFTFNGGMIHE